jgi:gas vesicle protein
VKTVLWHQFREAGNVLSRFSGFALAAAFYAVLSLFSVPWLERYFLGHPVAVAATVLFCVALGQLANRFVVVSRGWRQSALINDRDLLPESLHQLAGLDPNLDAESATESLSSDGAAATPSETSMIRYGAVQSLDRESPIDHRIEHWLQHLAGLPQSISETLLFRRIEGLLDRQRRRGHAHQLSDDIRDLSDRDADTDHDTLQFVRIIIWAIPMLGFLGTVVGITQTLGGLDFTDGAAAVDRLKSGLYVAFDTTALGLVLSVIAIFIQFPVEKSSRGLLEEIDGRTLRLLPLVLADPPQMDRDDPLRSLHQMTAEITRAVQTSVHSQAEIWRQTIDAAHRHWESSAAQSADTLRVVLQQSLGENLAQTLKTHTDGIRRVQREGSEQIDNRWQQWQTALSDNARVLLAHQKTLLQQGQLLAESHGRARELEKLQATLDENIRSLDQSVGSIDRGLESIAGAGSIADAMMTLAKAVDVLADRLPPQANTSAATTSQVGRAIASASTKPRRNAA